MAMAPVPSGAVLTYPNVQENFSQTIASFTSLSSTFAETSPHIGIYEDAYDIWFNGFGAAHTELMIWVDNEKQVPAGTKMATTTLGGHTYDVWRTSDGSCIAFVATVTFTSGTVDLLEIFDWIVGQTWLPSSATLSQVDFGVEIVDTAGANATYQFTDFSIAARPEAERDSASGGARDPQPHPRDFLQLLGHLESLSRGCARPVTRIVRHRQTGEELAPELVVVLLVRLDDLAVEARGGLIAARDAEADELLVADDGQRLARELPRSDPLDGRFERREPLQQRGARARLRTAPRRSRRPARRGASR